MLFVVSFCRALISRAIETSPVFVKQQHFFFVERSFVSSLHSSVDLFAFLKELY